MQKSESLVKLAELKALPLHQYMDKETLVWIKENNPFKDTSDTLNGYHKVFDHTINERIINYIPKKEWFLSPHADTIHGYRHILRVTIHSLNLGSSFGDEVQAVAGIAAMVHDLRRKDDKGDQEHGKRAAIWFRNHVGEIEQCCGITLSEQYIQDIYYTILYHEIPYEICEKSDNYKKHKTSVDILKAADALDRYRLPKLKWWIQDSLLRSKTSKKLKRFAFNLVATSEDSYLSGLDSISSVLNSLTALCN
ncbi:hypothetical protein A2714_05030 [Candidatus Woesebacteria bacterium RIFCSPHIGHO2_01_FULL_38_9]|nr:MAG: hypothetical protein A2714_05030 [Candidatus Woesebacteria bacterium RIFCSPHIGHO2_01_FULL_38_9]